MSAEDIPVEILVMIFENVEARDVIACRAVCRRWRDVVDSLSDEVWERYCSRDFWNPKMTNKVSNLSFRELYKSLALWSKVEKAEVICKQLPDRIVSHFKLLNNNTLSVIMNNRPNHSSGLISKMYDNQIEYYNMENMKLISRERYDFHFEMYDENDKLITLVDTKGALCVITKSNKKKFFVGKMYTTVTNYTLFNTEVYFVNIKEVVCVARLKVVDGEETIETEELEEIAEHIIAFSRATENSVNMLTDEGNIYCYQHHEKDFETCSQIDSWTPDIIYELWEFGFHWSDPNIYKWLRFFDEEQVNITKLNSTAIHSHNHVVLIGTSQRMVHIFKRPYKKGELVLYKAKPNRSIDMDIYSGRDTAASYRDSNNIQQLGITEILNGHRIVVLTKNKLFFVDLVHKQHKANKRSATRPTGVEPSTSSKKRAKTVKKSPIQPKAANNKNIIPKNNDLSKAERKDKSLKKAKRANENKTARNVTTTHVYNTRSKDKCLRSSNK